MSFVANSEVGEEGLSEVATIILSLIVIKADMLSSIRKVIHKTTLLLTPPEDGLYYYASVRVH